MPQLISHPLPSQANRLDSEMSPVEAVYVTGTLITQKALNAEYQQTPAEIRAQWQERRPKDRANPTRVTQNFERTEATIRAMKRYFEGKDVGSLEADTHRFLSLLSIPQ